MKFGSLSTTNALQPLSEGITPDPVSTTVTHVSGTVYQYGSYLLYSDLIKQAIDPVEAENVDLLGEQAGQVFDLLTRNVLIADGTAQYVNGRANDGAVLSTDIISAAECMEAVATLEAAHVRRFPDGTYKGIIHANTKYDLLQDSSIVNMMNESGDAKKNGLWNYSVGTCFGIDWYVAGNAYRTASGDSSGNVYYTMILGQGAFGIGGLAADSFGSVPSYGKEEPGTGKKISPVELIKKELGSGGTSDALNQRASMGWKTTFCAKVLDATRYIVLHHQCSLG